MDFSFEETDSEFVLRIPYAMKERAKKIQLRRWDSVRRAWVFPRNAETRAAIALEFGEEIRKQEAAVMEQERVKRWKEAMESIDRVRSEYLSAKYATSGAFFPGIHSVIKHQDMLLRRLNLEVRKAEEEFGDLIKASASRHSQRF